MFRYYSVLVCEEDPVTMRAERVAKPQFDASLRHFNA